MVCLKDNPGSPLDIDLSIDLIYLNLHLESISLHIKSASAILYSGYLMLFKNVFLSSLMGSEAVAWFAICSLKLSPVYHLTHSLTLY